MLARYNVQFEILAHCVFLSLTLLVYRLEICVRNSAEFSRTKFIIYLSAILNQIPEMKQLKSVIRRTSARQVKDCTGRVMKHKISS